MTTQTNKLDPEIVAAWREIGEAYKHRPKDVPPPTTLEAIEAMANLVSTVYGDALKELAEH